MTLAQQYAQALLTLTTNASSEELERARANMLATLTKRGHTKLLPRIVAEYARLLQSQNAAKPTITLARESDWGSEGLAIDRAAEILGTERGKLAVTIDPSIVGGFSIRTESAQFDATHKRALISLYQHLTT